MGVVVGVGVWDGLEVGVRGGFRVRVRVVVGVGVGMGLRLGLGWV